MSPADLFSVNTVLLAELQTLAALLRLDTIFTLSPWAYATLKTGGALYLIHLAIKTWRGARAPLGKARNPARRAFLKGVLRNPGNHRSILFAAAALILIGPAGLAAPEITAIVTTHFALEMLYYTGFALVLGSASARILDSAAKPVLPLIAAVLPRALGLKLMLQR